jgi:hypothetical protein
VDSRKAALFSEVLAKVAPGEAAGAGDPEVEEEAAPAPPKAKAKKQR